MATLHTTFTRDSRPNIQASILQRIVEQSFATVVLSRKSRETLSKLLNVREEAISVIPHGIPGIRFVPPPSIRPSSATGKMTLKMLSLGFFRPDKGLEKVLQAVQSLKSLGYDFKYAIAGLPQPQFVEQDEYCCHIHKLIRDLELVDSVHLERKFLTRSEQVKLIQRSHVGVFAYQDPDHASSGALSLTLGAGRPVICTPFEFALSTRAEVEGVCVARDFGTKAITDCLAGLFMTKMDLGKLAVCVHEQTRQWTWGNVGRAYEALLSTAHTS